MSLERLQLRHVGDGYGQGGGVARLFLPRDSLPQSLHGHAQVAAFGVDDGDVREDPPLLAQEAARLGEGQGFAVAVECPLEVAQVAVHDPHAVERRRDEPRVLEADPDVESPVQAVQGRRERARLRVDLARELQRVSLGPGIPGPARRRRGRLQVNESRGEVARPPGGLGAADQLAGGCAVLRRRRDRRQRDD